MLVLNSNLKEKSESPTTVVGTDKQTANFVLRKYPLRIYIMTIISLLRSHVGIDDWTTAGTCNMRITFGQATAEKTIVFFDKSES